MDNFPKNLKFLRERKGLKQDDMRSTIGFNQTTWNNYEKARSYPGFMDLIKISTYFDVNIDDIVFKDLSTDRNLTDLEKIAKFNTKGNLNRNGKGNLNHQNEENNNLVREASGHYITQNPIIEELHAEVAHLKTIIRFLTDHMEGLKAALIQERSQHPPPASSKKKAG